MAKARKKKTRRADPGPAAGAAAGREKPASGKGSGRGPDERPPAPWGPFPLMELAVLAGLILIVLGAITGNTTQIAVGLILGSLGGLELAVREHFAGYRSHTTLLAGVAFVLSTGAAYFVGELVLWVCLVVGATVAVVAFWWLRRAFVRASGGLSYRLR
ncbi:MAG: hypothetical protein JJE10_02560 [Thermoleophilia bacterium]|nr:hypothetical protein [Thermoleophilia bacterium]